MKCDACNLWWTDYDGDFPSCHADPNWSAPCEYEDDENDYEYESWDDY